MKRVYEVGKQVVLRFMADEGSARAAAAAYFALASLFPGLLLMLTLLGQFISGVEAQEHVVEMAGYYLPVPGLQVYIRENLHAVLAWRGVMGTFGGIVLLWSAKGTFLSFERGLNGIWRLQRPRHTVTAYVVAILVTVVIGALLLLHLSIITVLRAAVTWQVPVLGYTLDRLAFIWNALGIVLSPLMLFAIFMLLYAVLPRARLPFRILWPGALFGALSYRLLESGFVYYITYVAHLTLLYGAASGLLMLMLWLYLSANIFFLGAELIFVLGQRRQCWPDGPAPGGLGGGITAR